jgi:hypothetical protein
MTAVKLRTETLAHFAGSMLYERVPADYADSQAQAKCRALAAEFVESAWAKAQGAEYDLDEMIAELIPWARGLGYELLDEPPGCYLPAPSVYIRCWGPNEK